MTAPTLNQKKAAEIRQILDLARNGSATLAQLGLAHDQAIELGFAATAGELRGYIRHKITPPTFATTGRDLMLGVASGMLTHHLLRGI
jgi:hypothetical protein